MKTLAPPTPVAQSEPTPFQKFDRLFRSVISVPKAAIDREEAKWKRKRRPKKRG